MKNLFLAPALYFFLISSCIANEFNPDVLLEEASSMLTKKPDEALVLLRKAYHSRYPEAKTMDSILEFYHKIIQTYLETKQYGKVIAVTDEVLRLSVPKPYEFSRYKLMASSEQGEHNHCIFYCEEAISQNEINDEILFFKGKSFYQLKAFHNAIENLSKITPDFSGILSVYIMLGDSYYHRAEPQKALEWLQKAQAITVREDITALITKIQGELKFEENFQNGEPTPHFIIRAPKENHQELQDLVKDMLENTFHDHARAMQFYPDSPISVIIYDATKTQWSSRLQNPGWAAGVYDGQIRIPIGELKQDSYALETILRHELMHLFVDAQTRNSIPTWLNEGLAQYYEKPFIWEGENAFKKRESAPLPTNFKEVVTEALKNKRILDYQPLCDSFLKMDANIAKLAYAQGLFMTKYLIESHGIWKLQGILRDVYDGSLFSVAFKKHMEITEKDFYVLWAAHQKNQWKLQ